MSLTVLYVLPALLGGGFDLKSGRPAGSSDFFPPDVSVQVVSNTQSHTEYRLLDSTTASRDLIDASGQVKVDVKGGIFKAGVSGAYKSDTQRRDQEVTLVISARYETVTESIDPRNAKPKPNWKTTADSATHYIRSVTYGGWLEANLKLTANSPRDVQVIRAGLEAGGRLEVVDLEGGVEGSYMKDLASSVQRTEISIQSSVPLGMAPTNMSQLFTMLDEFPTWVRQHNNGRGSPIRLELRPLTELDAGQPRVLARRELNRRLREIEDCLEDLTRTRNSVSQWLNDVPRSLTEVEEEKVGKFIQQIDKILDQFYEVLGTFDFTSSISQFSDVLKAYGKRTFYSRYLLLRQETTGDVAGQHQVRSVRPSYVHWGSPDCSGDEVLFTGILISSSGKSTGGGVDLLCSDVGNSSMVAMSWRQDEVTTCSICRHPTAGSVRQFFSVKTCPAGWKTVYTGRLAIKNGHSAMVCVAEPAMTKPITSETIELLKPALWEGNAAPCIVCSY